MRNYLACLIFLSGSLHCVAQDSTRAAYTLNDCLRFALKAQPAVRRAVIDESITRAGTRIALSSALPQVSLNATYSHYPQLPTAFIVNPLLGSNERIRTTTGIGNTLIPTASATQSLFSNDVITAFRTAPLFREQSRKVTAATRIEVVERVSNAFYDVLLSRAQIEFYAEDTARLGKNLRDAYSQYVAGIVDKVDYKRAAISLNNSVAELRNAGQAVSAKTAVLKEAMGFPPERPLPLAADTTKMIADTYIDTTEQLVPTRRIEYSQLRITQQIQHETTAYYLNGFLPTVSAFYNYIPTFQSSNVGGLFKNIYPYSLYGVTVSLPIFQGFRRIENIRRSRLREERLRWDEVSLRLRINTQYDSARASYISNLNLYLASRENVQMAREVYEVIRLQYREGIKQYLEVITAEADLRSSEINYLNALYHLLQSKVSLQRALGDIPPDYPGNEE